MDDFAFVQTGPASALIKLPKGAAAEDEVEEPEPTPRPQSTPTPTRTPRSHGASETPDARGARESPSTPEAHARTSATRTKPAPKLNSDGIEVAEGSQATEVIFLESEQNPAVRVVDNRVAILVGFMGATLLICATIAGAAIYLKRQ
jgi:hypothetical protein